MLRPIAAESARRVRDYFQECRYDRQGLVAAGIGEEIPARYLRNLQRLLDLTSEPTAANLLYRLFRFGRNEDESKVCQLLPGWFLEACGKCDLLTSRSGMVSASVLLAPFDKLLVATDHAHVIEQAQDPDAVLIVNPTTWLLHRFAVPRPSAHTLELCAGQGAVGLAAAARSGQVTMTDLNQRAMDYAAFNASLNSIGNIECLTGGAFDPVAGRRFDHIVANPPFYVTPSMRFLFCNNELGLDAFCRHLARQAPGFLNEGGYFQMLCEWVEVEGEDWHARVEEWFDDSGCDVWVIRGNVSPTVKYAQERIREQYPFDWDADPVRFREWFDYYRRHRVVAVHRGLVAMRKRSGRNWMRVEETGALAKGSFGEAILQGFDNLDFLASAESDDCFLEARFSVAPGVRLDHRAAWRDGGWQPELLELVLADGIPRVMKVEPLVAEFLEKLDGSKPLAQVIAEMAANANAPVEQVGRECVAVSRRLMERGFLRCEASGSAAQPA